MPTVQATIAALMNRDLVTINEFGACIEICAQKASTLTLDLEALKPLATPLLLFQSQPSAEVRRVAKIRFEATRLPFGPAA